VLAFALPQLKRLDKCCAPPFWLRATEAGGISLLTSQQNSAQIQNSIYLILRLAPLRGFSSLARGRPQFGAVYNNSSILNQFSCFCYQYKEQSFGYKININFI